MFGRVLSSQHVSFYCWFYANNSLFLVIVLTFDLGSVLIVCLQNKLLSELVYSQRNLQNQLHSLKTATAAPSAQGAGYEDPLKTPAPRARLPAAAVPEQSPAGL